MQIKKNYSITFTDSSFERSSQEKNISKIKRQYTKVIAEMNKTVEELDRFDEFDSLQIDVEKYRKQDGTPYGITPMALARLTAPPPAKLHGEVGVYEPAEDEACHRRAEEAIHGT